MPSLLSLAVVSCSSDWCDLNRISSRAATTAAAVFCRCISFIQMRWNYHKQSISCCEAEAAAAAGISRNHFQSTIHTRTLLLCSRCKCICSFQICRQLLFLFILSNADKHEAAHQHQQYLSSIPFSYLFSCCCCYCCSASICTHYISITNKPHLYYTLQNSTKSASEAVNASTNNSIIGIVSTNISSQPNSHNRCELMCSECSYRCNLLQRLLSMLLLLLFLVLLLLLLARSMLV